MMLFVYYDKPTALYTCYVCALLVFTSIQYTGLRLTIHIRVFL